LPGHFFLLGLLQGALSLHGLAHKGLPLLGGGPANFAQIDRVVLAAQPTPPGDETVHLFNYRPGFLRTSDTARSTLACVMKGGCSTP
jgi:hypothetical protein